MNTTLGDASTSLISTSTRVVPRHTGRTYTRSDSFMWFFGQIHAKRFLVFVMFSLLFFSLYVFSYTSDSHFKYISIPGFDGKTNWIAKGNFQDVDAFNIYALKFKQVSDHSVPHKSSETPAAVSVTPDPNAIFCKNILNTWCYFSLTSILLAGFSLFSVERNWRPKCLKKLNPAFLLIPLFATILTFVAPLTIWSTISYRIGFNLCYDSGVNQCNTIVFWFNFIRLTVIPVVICWLAFLYGFFGCCLAFAYVWTRARAHLKARETAAASFRSFRDRTTLLRRPLAISSISKSCKGRFSFGRSSGMRKSKEMGSRPTLSSIFKDLNQTHVSSVSAPGDFAIRDSIDIEAGDISSLSRRPLDPVEEESDSHDESQDSRG